MDPRVYGLLALLISERAMVSEDDALAAIVDSCAEPVTDDARGVLRLYRAAFDLAWRRRCGAGPWPGQAGAGQVRAS